MLGFRHKYVKRLKLTRRVASFLYGQGFFFRVYLGPEVFWLLILQLYDSTVSGQRSRVEGGSNKKALMLRRRALGYLMVEIHFTRNLRVQCHSLLRPLQLSGA